MRKSESVSVYGCILVLTILIVGAVDSYAQGKAVIKRLGISNGLSNNSVRCIYQDKKGFIWFATYDGLNRYDGREFRVFRNKIDDSTSLPHNYIYTLQEDANQQLWVGTGQGLAIYDPTMQRFSRVYYLRGNSTKPQPVNFSLYSIKPDAAGNMYGGTNGYGLLVRRKGETVCRVIACDIAGKRISDYSVSGIVVENHTVMAFVSGQGLYRLDPASGVLQPVNTEVRFANCIYGDESGIVWVGAENGLYQYSVKENKYLGHFSDKPGELSDNNVTSITRDKNRNLWVGTDRGGISIFTIEHKFTYLSAGDGADKLSSESVFSLLRDREERIWIGTIKGGCNVIDEQMARFTTITRDPFSSNTIPVSTIYSFCETEDKDLLIGTDGGGLSVWNRRLNRFTNYSHQTGNPGSLSHNAVIKMLEDHEGKIWVATYGGGINLFSKSTGTFSTYPCIDESNGYENRFISLLYEDRQHTIWASTFNDGQLYRFDRASSRFIQFKDRILSNMVSMLEDRDGNLWAGNSGGLFRIDRSGKQHQQFELGKPVRAIYEDRTGHFWLGTEGGGLLLFDCQKGVVVQRFSDADGLCNNGVLNIREDSAGQLWMSTFNGLSCFNYQTKIFKNYYQSDGLQSNQFTYNAAIQLSSGELVFGGINGFSLFKPEQILPRHTMPPVFITNMLVNSQPLSVVSEFIHSVNDAGIVELQVPFNQAVFTFSFNALEFTSPEKINYAYYLEGWDKNWNYSGNINTINYNNLSEGTYTLRLKSTNVNGQWSEQETRLRLVILPPWYRSWWAYLIYILATGTLIWVYMRYRTQQAQLTYKMKLTELNAEKEKEINEKRQSFFTNITHEFRTPLTLIINPLKDLVNGKQKAEKGDIELVYRNARRLLSLVDQLLLFRKTESETGNLQLTKLDMRQMAEETFSFFIQQARAKHIQYSFDCSGQLPEIYGDREKLQIVFYNLLSNALKYTPDHGQISFRIWDEGNRVLAEVADSGPGIPPDTGSRLFEKFYQVNKKEAKAKAGFGIGLYLVKQLVDEHKGQLWYETEVGKGTRFKLAFLSGHQHFGDLPVYESGDTGSHELLDEIIAGEESIPLLKPQTDGLESVVSEKHSILITDDNPQMRNYLVQVFSQDFIVYEAGSGDEAFKVAGEIMPDVIISDVVMENGTGIEFCRQIKERADLSHIPFVLITGSFSPESKLKGIEAGADDYITKPFEKDMLVARVQSLIKKQQNLQKYFYNEITHQQNTLNISAEYKEFLEACIAAVERNLDKDDFNIQVLAQDMGMSHSKLYKKIKTISGQSANAFIRYIRLRKAAELFINSDYNINETAFYVGIKDIKYFREQFTRTFGMKPSAYIEKYRKVHGRNYKLNDKLTRENE